MFNVFGVVSHLCSRCLSLVVLRHKWLTFWQELYSQRRLCMIMLSMFFLADREIHFCKFFKFFVWALFEELQLRRPTSRRFHKVCFIMFHLLTAPRSFEGSAPWFILQPWAALNSVVATAATERTWIHSKKFDCNSQYIRLMSELVCYNGRTWPGGIRKDRLGCGGLRSLKKWIWKNICGWSYPLYFDRCMAARIYGTSSPLPQNWPF